MAHNAVIYSTTVSLSTAVKSEEDKIAEEKALRKLRVVQDADIPPAGYLAKFLIKGCGHGKALHHMYVKENGSIQFSHHKLENIQTEAIQVAMAVMGEKGGVAELQHACRPCAVAYYAWNSGKLALVNTDPRFSFGPTHILNLVRPPMLGTKYMDAKLGARLRRVYLRKHGIQEYEHPMLVRYMSSDPASAAALMKKLVEILGARFPKHVLLPPVEDYKGAAIRLHVVHDLSLGASKDDIRTVIECTKEGRNEAHYSSHAIRDHLGNLRTMPAAHHLFQEHLIQEHLIPGGVHWPYSELVVYAGTGKHPRAISCSYGGGKTSDDKISKEIIPLQTGWVDLRPILIYAERALILSSACTRIRVREAIEELQLRKQVNEFAYVDFGVEDQTKQHWRPKSLNVRYAAYETGYYSTYYAYHRPRNTASPLDNPGDEKVISLKIEANLPLPPGYAACEKNNGMQCGSAKRVLHKFKEFTEFVRKRLRTEMQRKHAKDTNS